MRSVWSWVNERERIQFSWPERVAAGVNGVVGEGETYMDIVEADPATARTRDCEEGRTHSASVRG